MIIGTKSFIRLLRTSRTIIACSVSAMATSGGYIRSLGASSSLSTLGNSLIMGSGCKCVPKADVDLHPNSGFLQIRDQFGPNAFVLGIFFHNLGVDAAGVEDDSVVPRRLSYLTESAGHILQRACAESKEIYVLRGPMQIAQPSDEEHSAF